MADYYGAESDDASAFFDSGVATDEAVGDSNISDNERVRVMVRVRPFTEDERRRSMDPTVSGESDLRTLVYKTQKSGRQFKFDGVLDQNTSQAQAFVNARISDILQAAYDGYAATVMAYGQTGSGKTYTMTGPALEGGLEGIIPRAARILFQRMEVNPHYQYRVAASYLEIYNEQLSDLLSPQSQSSSLSLHHSAGRGFFVEGLTVVECSSVEDLMAVVEEGTRNRHVSSHNLNKNSSRSHCLMSVYITSQSRADPTDTRHGKVTFVDLAGSENLAQSGSEGLHARETGHINRSLFTLGSVISILSDPKRSLKVVPYRDSKLTKLLMDSLGGSGVALMIACVSPAFSCSDETLRTLQFAARARNVRNKPVALDEADGNVPALRARIRQLEAEVARLRDMLGLSPAAAAAVAASVANSVASQSMRVAPTRRSSDSQPDTLRLPPINSNGRASPLSMPLVAGTPERVRSPYSSSTLPLPSDSLEPSSAMRLYTQQNLRLQRDNTELSQENRRLADERMQLQERIHHLEHVFMHSDDSWSGSAEAEATEQEMGSSMDGYQSRLRRDIEMLERRVDSETRFSQPVPGHKAAPVNQSAMFSLSRMPRPRRKPPTSTFRNEPIVESPDTRASVAHRIARMTATSEPLSPAEPQMASKLIETTKENNRLRRLLLLNGIDIPDDLLPNALMTSNGSNPPPA